MEYLIRDSFQKCNLIKLETFISSNFKTNVILHFAYVRKAYVYLWHGNDVEWKMAQLVQCKYLICFISPEL